jgi:general secretion pathway protein E
MNAPFEPARMAMPFSDAEIEAARAAARAHALALLDALAQACAADAQLFLNRLAATARLPVVTLAEMDRRTAAFELLAYGEALQRECLLFHGDDGATILVLADPFNLDLRDWAGERVHAPLDVRLALRGDIAAYLARHEETLRATDGIVSLTQTQTRDGTAEDISIRSISEDISSLRRAAYSSSTASMVSWPASAVPPAPTVPSR